MTVLGVNLSNSDPTYTWADLAPAPRSLPQPVLDAQEYSAACWREWLRLADAFDEGKATYEEVEDAFSLAAEAEEQYLHLKSQSDIVIH